MTGILDFLTGDKLVTLAEGNFSFGIPVDFPLLIVGAVFVMVLAWTLYYRTTVKVSFPLKILLVGLRSGILIILLLCLLQPVSIVSRVVPQESYLALFLDNSRSMNIRDMEDRQSRAAMMTNHVFGGNGLLSMLEEEFRVRVFSFDTDAWRIDTAEDLSFAGSRTVISQSLEDGMESLKGLPLSGVILISDGGDNSDGDPLRTVTTFKSADIPVFTLGVGVERLPKDLEIVRIHASETVMEGSVFDVNLLLRNQGYDDREIELQVEEGNRVVLSEKIDLKNSDKVTRHTLQLTAEREGILIYTVRISPQEDEIVSENNQRMFLVRNTRRQSDILYVEGHPRHEYKFIRRAIQGDKALRLVTYLQTGPHKFLRQGINSPEELEKGYPNSMEELFEYEAVIFGDVSRAFFSAGTIGNNKRIRFKTRRGISYARRIHRI